MELLSTHSLHSWIGGTKELMATDRLMVSNQRLQWTSSYLFIYLFITINKARQQNKHKH